MSALDKKEQSVSSIRCSNWVCALILNEGAIKNEPNEIYSIVRKGHKINPKYANGDYYLCSLSKFYKCC